MPPPYARAQETAIPFPTDRVGKAMREESNGPDWSVLKPRSAHKTVIMLTTYTPTVGEYQFIHGRGNILNAITHSGI